MRGARPTWQAAAATSALALSFIALPTTDAATTPARQLAPPPAPEPPRLAHTDDRDEIAQRQIARTIGEDGTTYDVRPAARPPWTPDPTDPTQHTGEATSTRGEWHAFVSTTGGDDDGEVYVVLPEGRMQVTCDNNAIESHPVMSPEQHEVAYASNANGNFDIWVATLVSPGPSPSPVPRDCDQWVRRPITNSGSADLWPAWTSDGGSVVFSSDRANDLGDLFLVPTTTAPEQGLRQLTNDVAADTQPANASFACSECLQWVAFTTTRYRSDGSLAVLRLSEDPAPPEVTSLWASPPGVPPGTPDPKPIQSSEAHWSPDQQYLAFSTTRDDSYGDVHFAEVSTTSGRPRLGDPDSTVRVANRPGVAESHGAWLGPFASGGSSDPDLADMAFTVRSVDADISDVMAADGSGRRVIANKSLEGGRITFDEAGPTYSPDGTQIAYSREILGEDDDSGRVLVVAAADGSNAVALSAERLPGDVDLDPAWSPDGTEIAFVRLRAEDELTPSAVWAVDVSTGDARSVTVDPPPGHRFDDQDPSWSPDGERLAVVRHDAAFDVSVELLIDPASIEIYGTASLDATVTNTGQLRAEQVTLTVVIPPELDMESGDEPGVPCTLAGRVVTCLLGDLAGGSQRAVDLGSVRSSNVGTHSVSATVASSRADAEESNDTADATLEVTPGADIEVTITADPASIPVGTRTDLDMTVTNHGPDYAFDVDLTMALPPPDPGGITDTPPPLTARTASDDACRVEELKVTCALGEMASGEDRTITVEAEGTEPADDVPVSAIVDATNLDPDPDNNGRRVFVTVEAPASPEPTFEVRAPAGRSAPGRVPGAAMPIGRAVPTNVSIRAAHYAPPPGVRPQIWTIDADTGVGAVLQLAESGCPPTRVCPPVPIVGRSPAWSPDGKSIAYENTGSILLAALSDADADGQPDRPESANEISPITGFATDGSPMPSRKTISVAEDPAWSPDGSEIAIAGQPAGHPDQRGIFALKPDGSGLRAMPEAAGRGPETEPAWQPYADLRVTLTAVPPSIPQGNTTTLTAVITNSGPAPAASVVLALTLPPGLAATTFPTSCDTSTTPPTCALGRLAKGGSTTIAVVAVGAAIGPQLVEAAVTSATPDNDPSNTAVVTVLVTIREADVAVAVALSHNPGYVGGTDVTVTIRVTNRGALPAEAVTLATAYPTGVVATGTPDCLVIPPCLLGQLAPGSQRTFHVKLKLDSAGVGPVTSTVTTSTFDPVLSNNESSVVLTVKQPILRLLPPVGSPGLVTLAYGEDFPPRAKVTLAWKPGITTNPGPFIVGRDGKLRAPVLIVRRDQLGVRILEATNTAGLFGPVQTPMLVVPRTMAPPRFVSRG